MTSTHVSMTLYVRNDFSLPLIGDSIKYVHDHENTKIDKISSISVMLEWIGNHSVYLCHQPAYRHAIKCDTYINTHCFQFSSVAASLWLSRICNMTIWESSRRKLFISAILQLKRRSNQWKWKYYFNFNLWRAMKWISAKEKHRQLLRH